MKNFGIVFLFLFFSPSVFAILPDPPGPYIKPKTNDFSGQSFGKYEFVVGTYYFYWYNIKTGEHIKDSDGTDACTTHYFTWKGDKEKFWEYNTPPVFSYDEENWHEHELNDLILAGIDFIMPVYWGEPGKWDWNNIGMQTLGSVLLKRDAQGKKSPKVGLFYDDTTLDKVDLTTQNGKDKFYGTIRDFYSLIPPKHWARVNEKAIVCIYHSTFPSKIGSDIFQQAKERFKQDFGGVDLFFIADSGWISKGNAKPDLIYSWGAALKSGPTIYDVCAVGPGFNNSAVPWGDPKLTNPRNNGEFYNTSWLKVFGAKCNITAIETWNEYHESTDVSRSAEEGDKYINFTNENSKRFKFKGSYVRAIYRYYLSREPDEDGFKTYTDFISKNPPADARDAIMESSEAKGYLSNEEYLTFLYNHYLKREPDSEGLNTYLNYFKNGGKRYEVRDFILDSTEAKSKVSDEQFVLELYHRILFREPDSGGYNNWLNELKGGMPRHEVRDGFINSLEFKSHDPGSMDIKKLTGIFDFNGYKEVDDACSYFYHDTDGDGYGWGEPRCLYKKANYYNSSSGGDCNEKNISINPGASEICNGKDENCNGAVDENLTKQCSSICGNGIQKCQNGNWGECDAQKPVLCMDFTTCTKKDMCVIECPEVPLEICNNKDDNCNGEIDETCAKEDIIISEDAGISKDVVISEDEEIDILFHDTSAEIVENQVIIEKEIDFSKKDIQITEIKKESVSRGCGCVIVRNVSLSLSSFFVLLITGCLIILRRR